MMFWDWLKAQPLTKQCHHKRCGGAWVRATHFHPTWRVAAKSKWMETVE